MKSFLHLKNYAQMRNKNKLNVSQVIAESFCYSLVIDHPLLAIYLRNAYPVEIYENSSIVIDSVFNNISKFVESSKLSNNRRIKFIEEYFYLIEDMINYVNYEQAKHFVSLCSQILKYGMIDDSFVMIQNMKSRTLNDTKLDNFHKNFTVFSLNPIKE